MVRFLICPRLGQALSGPMYFRCELVEAGGLMSCGTSTAESYRQHLQRLASSILRYGHFVDEFAPPLIRVF
jgi:hypothetical protein